jgi:hypothetical protein
MKVKMRWLLTWVQRSGARGATRPTIYEMSCSAWSKVLPFVSFCSISAQPAGGKHGTEGNKGNEAEGTEAIPGNSLFTF